MKLSMRIANADDVENLAQIHSESLQAAYTGIFPQETLDTTFSLDRRREGFTRELIAKTPITLIAFLDGEPVGLLSFGESRHILVPEDTIELWRIYLRPKFWGKDYGNTLLNYGLHEIKSQNYKKVILWVLDVNARARKFYEKNNFLDDGQILGNVETDGIMERLYTLNL